MDFKDKSQSIESVRICRRDSLGGSMAIGTKQMLVYKTDLLA